MSTPTKWDPIDLKRIVDADDLHIAPFRADGVTRGTPTWIWAVAVGSDLFVRAYNGNRSRWHEAALRERAGQITAAGSTHDVSFEPVEDSALRKPIDEAYRVKYAGSPYLDPMVSSRAQAATVRITPRIER
jgi:hypothetical protein